MKPSNSTGPSVLWGTARLPGLGTLRAPGCVGLPRARPTIAVDENAAWPQDAALLAVDLATNAFGVLPMGGTKLG